MPRKLANKDLDLIDKKILLELQNNGRVKLSSIAKKVGLGIDAVHNRIKEMQKKEIFTPSIFIDSRKIGFPLIVDIKIKLKFSDSDIIRYLTQHPRVTELLSVAGDFDLTCVIIARDTEELNTITTDIRKKYAENIVDWKSVFVLKTHKFEYYDMMNLDKI